MTTAEVLLEIKQAIENAPRNGYVAELHVQCLKHSAELEGVSGSEFCSSLGIGKSFGTEFAKMKKISGRLKNAGLKVELL